MNIYELEDRPDQSGSWFDQDSKELFIKNAKSQPASWRYRNIGVSYRLNSMGYRTQEFDRIPWRKCIVLFGCSFDNSFGVFNQSSHPCQSFLYVISGLEGMFAGLCFDFVKSSQFFIKSKFNDLAYSLASVNGRNFV